MHHQLNEWPRLLIGTLIVALIALIGCRDSGLPTIPVRGKVTFAGGPPPKPGSIAFSPIRVQEGLPNRPGRGNFGTDGEFEITSFQENDGLIPGTYQPHIECWLQNPNPNVPSTFDTYNAVPKDFQPETVTVDADAGVVELVIDVAPKKK
jgi:hypothetical protein